MVSCTLNVSDKSDISINIKRISRICYTVLTKFQINRSISIFTIEKSRMARCSYQISDKSVS